MAIRSNGKALQLGAGCLKSETFLYLSGVIHHIGWCLIGEVLRYIHIYHVLTGYAGQCFLFYLLDISVLERAYSSMIL